LLLGPHNPALIAAKWESDSLDVVKILPDSSEQARTPGITSKRILPVMVKGIAITVRSATVIVRSIIAMRIKAAIVSAAPNWRRRVPPHDVERIPFRSPTGIVDANDRRAAITRIANQLLPTPAVNAGKAELAGIPRQRSGAFKAPPLRGSSRKIPKVAAVAANFHLG
jgi:hypothetical protein